MVIEWETVAVFMTAASCGGVAAVSAHWYRYARCRIRRGVRLYGLLAFANGIMLSLAAALATYKVDKSPPAIIFAGIVVGSLCGMLGPDWVILWLASAVDVVIEARKQQKNRQGGDASASGSNGLPDERNDTPKST